MRREAVAFALSGVFFGVLIGWIIGAEHTAPSPAAPAAPQQTAAAPADSAGAAAPASNGQPQAPPPLDQQQATALESQANASPKNAAVRVQLGNLYFDAERYDQAIPWYQAALALDPKDVDVSTDLGVSYWRTKQSDRAIAQFDHSLSIDPRHVKTLLNKGIVLAFDKGDLAGAAKVWQQVVAIAPNSDEGRMAAQGLEGMKAAASGASGGAAAPMGAPAGGQ